MLIIPILFAIFNVMNYGAVGDGITNDTQSFINTYNAIPSTGNAGFYVPCGNYLLNATNHFPLIIQKPNVMVFGDSKDCSKLTVASHSVGTITVELNAKGGIVQQLTLDGNYKNQTHNNANLKILNCSGCEARDVNVMNSSATGIFVQNSKYVHLKDILINDSSLAIQCYNATGSTIPNFDNFEDITINGTRNYSGIVYTHCNNGILTNIHAYNLYQGGIELTDSLYTIVSNSQIINFGLDPINGGAGIGSGIGSTITGNYVDGKGHSLTYCYNTIGRPSGPIKGYSETWVSHESYIGNTGYNCGYGFYGGGAGPSNLVKYFNVSDNNLNNMTVAKIGLNGAWNATITGNSGTYNKANIVMYNSNGNLTLANNN